MAEDETTQNDEGMSTPKKVVTGAAVGLATAAAVGVGKKLLSDDSGDGDEEQGSRARQSGKSSGSGSRARQSGRSSGSSSRSRSGSSNSKSRARSTSGTRKGSTSRTSSSGSKRSGSTRSGSSSSSRSRSSSSKRSSSTSSSRSSGSGRTKEQLYAQATRLKIDGRSKMTKAQLERAVQRAR